MATYTVTIADDGSATIALVPPAADAVPADPGADLPPAEDPDPAPVPAAPSDSPLSVG